MQKFILSIDQGTSSTRSIIFNKKFEIVSYDQLEFKQFYPKNGFVEHDPDEIFNSVLKTSNNVIKKAKIHSRQISSIGITNQRETVVIWDRITGNSIYNAIVWQDTRTQDICDELVADKDLSVYFDKTGLPVATYFSLSKILWLIRNVPDIKKTLDTDVCFGTIDSWLIYNLTGNYYTDVTNASRTLLYDLYKKEIQKLENLLQWDLTSWKM